MDFSIMAPSICHPTNLLSDVLRVLKYLFFDLGQCEVTRNDILHG